MSHEYSRAIEPQKIFINRGENLTVDHISQYVDSLTRYHNLENPSSKLAQWWLEASNGLDAGDAAPTINLLGQRNRMLFKKITDNNSSKDEINESRELLEASNRAVKLLEKHTLLRSMAQDS